MKLLSQKIFFSLLTVILFSGSCIKKGGPCEEASDINNSEIGVIFKDSSGKYLYEEINPLYNKDSLKVFDQNGKNLILLNHVISAGDDNAKGIYSISFGNIYDNATDQTSFNSDLCKKFIIKYRYNEVDTVQACFKSEKYKCGELFKTLKVFQKGKLLTTVENTTSAQITLTKP